MIEQTNPPVEEQPVVEIIEQDVISETAPIEDIVEISEENDQSNLIEQLQQEIADLKFQVADYKDRFVRQQADMENTRKRLQRDVEDAHKFALKNVALELLPVCDSMEMEQAAAQKENADINALREGSALIYKMLSGVLEKVGVQAINPEGEKFNPDFHEALAMQPVENQEPNSIIFVQQKGYQLNGRLLRPARVIIAKAME
ncbi:MAG: nucleotide exchange factor GrpE [Pseudomonadota bacterium]|jgi:molecular chaperone GrpE